MFGVRRSVFSGAVKAAGRKVSTAFLFILLFGIDISPRPGIRPNEREVVAATVKAPAP
jgi:hypothetical protein